MQEKRSHKRQPRKGRQEQVTIRFEVQEEFSGGHSRRTAVVTDVSQSGVGLCTEEPLELGQRLKFLNTKEHADFSENGQVIWTAESQDGFRIGVKFV